MLKRLRVEPQTKPFLEATFTLTDQEEGTVAEVLFGLHPELLFKLVGGAAVRQIQGDPELMKKFLAFGSEDGAFVLGSPRMKDAGLEFPFKFYVVTPKASPARKRR